MTSTDLNDRVSSVVGLDMNALVTEVRRLSLASDMARARAEQLEHTRKVVLAEQRETERARLAREGERVTEARLDDLARCSVSYKGHLDALRAAREDAGRAFADYQAARQALDVAGRQLSFAQTELKASGY